MKRIQIWNAAYAAAVMGVLLWMTVPTVAVVTFTGCASVLPGNDPLVVNAERTASTSFDLIKGFLQYEKDNRALLWRTDQGIKAVADKLRDKAPQSIETLRNATKAYKKAKTPQNKAALSTWLAVVNSLLADATSHMAKSVQAVQSANP